MTKIERFEDMKIWQMGRRLVSLVYELTRKKEFAADFGLKDQIRRSAVSIPSNVAEGFERSGNKELIYFLYIAKGSAGELRTQLLIALDLKYVSEKEWSKLNEIIEEIGRMIQGFINYLRNSGYNGEKFKSPIVKEPESEYEQDWKSDPNFQF